MISWVEDGLWRVSLWGVAGVRPARALPELLAFARAVRTPIIAELLEGAEPVSAAAYYANSWSRWLRYDRLPRFPDGLVVVGSAAFHPNYEHGQGMTFCAMTANLVAEHLDRHELGAGAGASQTFQRALGEMTSPWWDWNLAVEVVVPNVVLPEIPREIQLRHHYFRLVREAAAVDFGLWKAVLEVNQAIRHPSRLMQPSMVWRVLRQQQTRPEAQRVDLAEIPRKLGL